VTTTTLTAREFNQDTGRAKRAAEDGPVIITDRGKPSHVLLSSAAFQNPLRFRSCRRLKKASPNHWQWTAGTISSSNHRRCRVHGLWMWT
jgi:prevent-host-death family protein